jgi:hypothetical protein
MVIFEMVTGSVPAHWGVSLPKSTKGGECYDVIQKLFKLCTKRKPSDRPSKI